MKVLLITAPLTQLNTPYPATAFLKGYLQSKLHQVEQVDLGIELVSELFTKESLEQMFSQVSETMVRKASKNAKQIFRQQHRYIYTIDAVMQFLRGKDATLATRICNSEFLPQASRFNEIADVDWAFGSIGFADRAKYLASLYIADITDFIKELVSPYFDLSRYAEHLSVYIPDFAPLQNALQEPLHYTDSIMLQVLEEKISAFAPSVIGFSIPFPGNLYATLRCGQYIKQKYPNITIVWGGGYVSTELRQLQEPLVFNYTDYVLLDDGEQSFDALLTALSSKDNFEDKLIKTITKNKEGKVVYIGSDKHAHIPFNEIATPDYLGLPLDKYISLIEIANPMHKLWSDGRWNKLMLAHGCYWAKCAFCDTSLPYIANYDPASAQVTVDRIEAIIAQTKSTGFHFVDEAAPPKLLADVSKEITKRFLTVSWWTNIRFEKAFTYEVCQVMSEAGCIAVSGGIEVASNRLLQVINKGVTIEQAAKTAYNLTQNNIMVHAYLMYGFPTQTLQETVDGLEIIRQMFAEGLIQSAFWHRYAMTIHSPSGKNPEQFGATSLCQIKGTFANNEIDFTDTQNLDFEIIGEALRKATFNYMNGLGYDMPVHQWFEDVVPQTSIHKNYIRNCM